jgi:hypothetical protein
VKQITKNKIQDGQQRRMTDFFNYSVPKDVNYETAVLFNKSKKYRKNTAILDTAILKTQTKAEWNNAGYW